MIDRKTLYHIKKWLPKGYVKSIHETTGYSKSAISRVLNGDYYNEFIINEAIELSRKNKKEIEKLERDIKRKINDTYF